MIVAHKAMFQKVEAPFVVLTVFAATVIINGPATLIINILVIVIVVIVSRGIIADLTRIVGIG